MLTGPTPYNDLGGTSLDASPQSDLRPMPNRPRADLRAAGYGPADRRLLLRKAAEGDLGGPEGNLQASGGGRSLSVTDPAAIASLMRRQQRFEGMGGEDAQAPDMGAKVARPLDRGMQVDLARKMAGSGAMDRGAMDRLGGGLEAATDRLGARPAPSMGGVGGGMQPLRPTPRPMARPMPRGGADRMARR